MCYSDCYMDKLSNELLVYIFSFLSVRDLCNLKETCKRFHNVIESWDDKLIRSHVPLATNQTSPIFLSRCQKIIPTKLEKLRVESNWLKGKYREYSYFHVKRKYMPWLHLDRRYLWFSRGSNINVYKRFKKSISQTPYDSIVPKCRADVTKFRVRDDYLAAGLSDGSVFLQSLTDRDVCCVTRGDSYTYSVDICHRLVASGHRNNALRISYVRDGHVLVLEERIAKQLDERAWCVNFNEDGRRLAVGTSSVRTTNKSVFVYDSERFEECGDLQADRTPAGTLDLKWDGPHTVWSCGLDLLKKWDLRVGKCVQEFDDPFHYNLYCLDYDYFNTVMVGTYMHGRVVMWDVRHSKCVQLFFMDSCRGKQRSSPVYGLAFDSACLFAATDQNLNVLNFDSYRSTGKDYTLFI